jgi:molybdopterin/thiamine biosynthesis adenylyltransferase
MALANFFDRAATAAAQILKSFDLSAFESALKEQVIGIAFDGQAARSAEGVATLELVTSLLARLYPAVAIITLDGDAVKIAERLRQQAKSINPKISIRRTNRGVTLCVVLGRTKPAMKCPLIFSGSDGWVAMLSRLGPIGSGRSKNPFGAGAAACFAAANIFRLVFAKQLSDAPPDEEIRLSMLDYSQHGPTKNNPNLRAIDLGDAHLVGLGAIGNGASWALSRIPGLSGKLNLVDHEAIALSNLQRYVLPGQAEIGIPKVDFIASTFRSRSLTLIPHQKRWDEYVSTRSNWHFERVAVALDTAADRISVQGALPKWIVNAWTQEIDLGVSRHTFVDNNACLACLYLPEGKVKDEDERVAIELGLPDSKIEVRTLLHTGAPIDDALILRIAEALAIPAEPLMQFRGQPLRTFYQDAICGGIVFKLSNGGQPAQTTVPMSFQSALAGVMLAAELVKHASGSLDASTTMTRINLLRPIGTHLNDPRAKDRSARCICADADFVDAYRYKYLRKRQH